MYACSNNSAINDSRNKLSITRIDDTTWQNIDLRLECTLTLMFVTNSVMVELSHLCKHYLSVLTQFIILQQGSIAKGLCVKHAPSALNPSRGHLLRSQERSTMHDYTDQAHLSCCFCPSSPCPLVPLRLWILMRRIYFPNTTIDISVFL